MPSAPIQISAPQGSICLCILTDTRLSEARTATFDQFNLVLTIWAKQTVCKIGALFNACRFHTRPWH